MKPSKEARTRKHPFRAKKRMKRRSIRGGRKTERRRTERKQQGSK